MVFAKSTKVAIAVMSRLAESHGDDVRLSAATISRDRKLPRPFVGKVLSALATGGLVTSVRGPGGGFALAFPPDQISLMDVAELFERSKQTRTCMVGGGICSDGLPCPVHVRFGEIQRASDELLQSTTFEVFRRPVRAGRPIRSKR